MTRIQLIKQFLGEWSNSIYRLNTEGAKYYGATFYTKTKWDGAFEWYEDDVKKWDYQVDLTTGIIRRGNKIVGTLDMTRRPIAIYTVSNCIGVAIYDIDGYTDKILVGVNDQEPEWVDLKIGEDGRCYFDWYGGIYLDECSRV